VRSEILVVLCSINSRVSATAASDKYGRMKEVSAVEMREYECGTQRKRGSCVREAASGQLATWQRSEALGRSTSASSERGPAEWARDLIVGSRGMSR